MSYNFVIGKTYSFDVYPAAVIGNDYKAVRLLAIMDQSTANQQLDTFGIHAQVKSYLPDGSPAKATDYNYLKILTTSGQQTIIGIPWIKENTITEVIRSTAQVKISNFNTNDTNRLRECLVQNGFSNIEVTVLSN